MKSITEKSGFLERFAAKCGMSSSKLLFTAILTIFLTSVSYVLLAWGVPAPTEINFYGNTTSNYTNSTAFTVNWTMSDTYNVSNYTIYIFNSTQLVNITSNKTAGGGALGYYFSIGVNGGNYTFNVSAINQSAGDSGANATSAWMYVDTAAPTSNTPADAFYGGNASATIGWLLQDSARAGSYSVYRNGTVQNNSLSWANNTNLAVWVNTSLEGLLNYTITYNDSVGNQGTADSVFITIDTLSPSIPAVVQNGSVVSNKQLLTLNITVTDGAGSGVANCTANVGGRPNVTAAVNSTGWCNLAGLSMASLALGATNINLYVNDTVGNMNYTTLYKVIIGGPVSPGVTQWNTTNPGPSINLS